MNMKFSLVPVDSLYDKRNFIISRLKFLKLCTKFRRVSFIPFYIVMKEEDVLDNLLDQVGDFGRLQVVYFILTCIVVVFHSSTHVAYVFAAFNSDYRCLIPECDGSNPEYEPNWIKNAIPFTSSNKPAKCETYAHVNGSIFYDNCPESVFDKSFIVGCSSYVFRDNENYIGREFNLLCDENLWKLTMVGTLNTVGMFFGLLLTGIISDKFGRKFVLLVGMSACGITGVIKAFSPSYEWYCLFEFVEAIFAAGTYGCGFILGVELVTPKNRVLTGCISCSSYALGEALLAVVAWSVRDWKSLIFIIYGPCIPLILLYWTIPESIRWYLSKGRIEEPKEILRKFAAANGKKISEESLDKLKIIIKEQEDLHETVSFMEMLKSTPLFLRFVNCSFCWITCAFLFYGLTLNSVTLSSNSYADFIYISLIEIPAYWGASFLADRIGRKYTICGSFAITSISCFSFVFMKEGSEWLHIVIYCMGKFGATSAFMLIYVIASEIFPTSLRHTTMGMSSMIGRIGSVASPQIPLLGQLWKPLPLLMFASLAAIAGCTSLFFPETLNIKLPDTIKETENIGMEACNKKDIVNAT